MTLSRATITAILALTLVHATHAQVRGPSTASTPYVLPVPPGIETISVLTVDNTGAIPDDVVPKTGGGSYGMTGKPDGMGAFDNGDGTFTLLVNHELTSHAIVRAHGGTGAFVSKWIISKNSLAVLQGEDLMKRVYGWDAVAQASSPTSSPLSFESFCSGDLPEPTAFLHAPSGLGTTARIYLHGEEVGVGIGRLVATVVTGPDTGNSYVLGKFQPNTNGSGLAGAAGAWENAPANPFPQDKTVVMLNDDGGSSFVRHSIGVYVGTKTSTGSEVEKAGLMNGTLAFVSVVGNPVEIVDAATRATTITNGTAFSLSPTTATTFSRPEDGAWNPLNLNQYYFVTTDQLDTASDGLGAQVGQTRLWRLTFADITNPELGGTIDLLIDGRTVDFKKVNMFDNITVNKTTGHVLLEEDPGGSAHSAKIWEYDPSTFTGETNSGILTLIAKHDPARFGDRANGVTTPATAPFNTVEESSGIIDITSIMAGSVLHQGNPGEAWYISSEQAHYSTGITPAQVEGGQLFVIHQIAPPNLGPDLVFTATSAPASSGAGLPLTVSETAKNQGGASAGATTTRFYLSTNTIWDAADVHIGFRDLPALAAGDSNSASTSLTIPAGTLAGAYYVIAKTDADQVLQEPLENNNAASTATIQIGPDLVVSALDAPKNTGAGATMTVTETTRNQGAGDAAASTTRYFLSTNGTLDAGDTLIGERTVPALTGLASSAGTAPVTIPAGTAAGTWFIIAQADGPLGVGETVENNNSKALGIAIGPDLIVSALSGPASAGAGATVSVTDTTLNQGAGGAGASTTRYFLSANSTLDAGDTLLGERAVPALVSLASSPGTVPVTIPAGTATGTWYFFAKADAPLAVPETIETNNTKYVAITIGPDLVVSALGGPASAGAGTTISVTDTTRNQGLGDAAASTTRYFLSANSTLDAGDALLGERAVPALATLASSAGTSPLTIPAATATGTWYFFAKADAALAFAETLETNNTKYVAITVGPDLVVSSLGGPASAGAGTAISVADTTRNQGLGDAAASITRYFLSANTTLDAGDALLSERAVPALATLVSSAGMVPVTIPAGTATGTWYFFAKTDDPLAVPETIETNNTRYFTIAIGPDLVVSVLSGPASAGAGTAINLTDTTRNQSPGNAGVSITRYFLSIDVVLDAGDPAIGERAAPALGALVSSVGTTPVTIPAGTTTGSYYIIAKADASLAVAETIETNNTRYVAITIGSDLVVPAIAAPANAVAGTAINVTDTTRNQGGSGAAASVTRYFLSTNAALDAGDILLGERAIPALAALGTSIGTVSVTIPAGTAPGTYYIIASADAGLSVVESVEINNTRSRAITIGP